MALQSTIAVANIVLQATATEVTFSSIPGFYRDLFLVIDGNVTGSLTTRIRFNGDSGSNYSYVSAAGDNANGVYSMTTTNTFLTPVPDFAHNNRFQNIYQIFDASATDKHKPVLIRAGVNATSPNMVAGRWANTAAINSINISSSANAYTAGTVFSLYGRIA